MPQNGKLIVLVNMPLLFLFSCAESTKYDTAHMLRHEAAEFSRCEK